MDFATRLRELRTAKGLSQTELGKLFNLSKQSISSYENGGSAPGPEMLGKLADFFGVSLDYLLGRTDDPRGIRAEDEERSRELDELLAEEQVHLNGEPLTVEEKEALLAVIKMIKRNKAARQKNEKQDSTPK